MGKYVDRAKSRSNLEVDCYGRTDIVKVAVALELAAEDLPDIIRCKDCKHRSYDEWDRLYWCVECEYRCNKDDWFCAGGERRTDGKE